MDVGQICIEAGLEGESGYVVCCNVLDSDRFAKDHALWYHHRTGAWGTEEAEYTFLLGVGTKGALADRPSRSPWRIIRVLLWMAIFACSAGVVWGGLMLALRLKAAPEDLVAFVVAIFPTVEI